MSENRSHEEYHDPDYRQFQPSRPPPPSQQPDANPNDCAKTTIAAATTTTQNPQIKTPDNQRETICRIIEREFQRELTNKEQELHEINKRIDEAKQLLAKVRYVVVHNYYNRKNLLRTEEEIAAVQKSQQESMTNYPVPGDKPQMPIHPSLKKLLGKRPINYDEILKSRPTRRAAQNATEQFQKLAKKPTMMETKIKTKELAADEEKQQQQPVVECKKPRYVAPSTSNNEIRPLNSARGRNNYRHLLVVGNVSKYIGDEEAGLSTSITHKWVIYIASKTAVPVEQIVSRARFFLHESYKPNDVIEVNAPPFQIIKRGWGEFPVRIQLYFHEHLMQKPVQIFHTIILDKKHSGMQTMGAETIVELWLNVPNTVDGQSNDDDSGDTSKSQGTNTISSVRTMATPEPIPSTSSQSIGAVVPNKQISNLCTEVQIKQEPGVGTIPTPVPLPVPMPVPTICDKPIATTEQIHSTDHNYPSILTTPIKIEQSTIPQPIIAGPSKQMTTISNQNITNVASTSSIKSATISTSPLVAVGSKTNTPKRFIKCVSKDGKISLMELVQDESNPKVFKMVLPKGVGTGKINLQQPQLQQQQQSQAMNSIKLVTPSLMQPIKICAVLPSTSSGAVPIIRNLTGKSMNFITTNTNTPVTNLNLATINSASAVRTSPQIANKSNVVVVSKPPTSLPKLVAINSPKTTTTPLPVISKAFFAPGQQLPSSTRIIKKDNKILVLDSKQLPKTQRHKQSLLKPQVSLLKPRSTPTTTFIRNSLKKITVTNIPGIEHKNINVFVPNDIGMATKSVFKAKNTAKIQLHNYSNHLENRFMARKTFSNMTEAIAWLLKAMPLVSSFAAQDGFRESFPFVVSTMADFYSLHVAKQRSFEWLRARYINRLVAKHITLKDFRRWTTKEIILYGRWFGYTPQSVFKVKTPSSTTESSENVRDIVKSEIMREHLQNDIISFNTRLRNWITETETIEMKHLNRKIGDQIIEIDIDIENDEGSEQKEPSPKKVNNNCIQLPIVKGSNEVMWINEVCRKMQIRFGQEEIVDGVLHRSAEVAFATALRSFVEDLLRKCSGNKLSTIDSESPTNTVINNDDVLRTVSTIQRFDFLTNKHLGIDKTNSN